MYGLVAAVLLLWLKCYACNQCRVTSFAGILGTYPAVPGPRRRGKAKTKEEKEAEQVSVMEQFWQFIMAAKEEARNKVGDFAKLAEILIVMVAGSIEDERLFSILNYILGKYRQSIDESMDKSVPIAEDFERSTQLQIKCHGGCDTALLRARPCVHHGNRPRKPRQQPAHPSADSGNA